MEIKVINKSKHDLPSYATTGSAGMDLKANLSNSIEIHPRKTIKVPTGIYIELPVGFEAQIRPRSSLSLKGIKVQLDTFDSEKIKVDLGTIDSDYRGEINVIMYNSTDIPFVVCNGDRIAQMVIAKYEQAKWKVVDELSQTERGDGGFGSTGK